jgi:hypothetical protein
MPNDKIKQKSLKEILGALDDTQVYGTLITAFSLRLGQVMFGAPKMKAWGQQKSLAACAELAGKLGTEILGLLERRCKGTGNLDVSELVAVCALTTGIGAFGSDPQGNIINDKRIEELGAAFTAGVKAVVKENRRQVVPASPQGIVFPKA